MDVWVLIFNTPSEASKWDDNIAHHWNVISPKKLEFVLAEDLQILDRHSIGVGWTLFVVNAINNRTLPFSHCPSMLEGTAQIHPLPYGSCQWGHFCHQLQIHLSLTHYLMPLDPCSTLPWMQLSVHSRQEELHKHEIHITILYAQRLPMTLQDINRWMATEVPTNWDWSGAPRIPWNGQDTGSANTRNQCHCNMLNSGTTRIASCSTTRFNSKFKIKFHWRVPKEAYV